MGGRLLSPPRLRRASSKPDRRRRTAWSLLRNPPQGQGLAFERLCIQHLHQPILAKQDDKPMLWQGMDAQDGLQAEVHFQLVSSALQGAEERG